MKYTIDDLKALAASKAGLCLSDKYTGVKVKYSWVCNQAGHRPWEATWDNILQNKWCPECGFVSSAKASRLTILDLEQVAKAHGGKCLSTEYTTCKAKYKWLCSNNHTWEAAFGNVRNSNNWCPSCAGLAKPNITTLQKHAQSRNGLLITSQYTNAYTKLVWQCENKHSWLANWHDISSGRWCPECASFKSERACRALLENKLGIELKKFRFSYNNSKYEFDGYNEEHKIAFEYHGIQHFKYPNYFHKTEDIFKTAQSRDLNKEQYCKEQHIRYIIIPYTESKTLSEHIDALLLMESTIV